MACRYLPEDGEEGNVGGRAWRSAQTEQGEQEAEKGKALPAKFGAAHQAAAVAAAAADECIVDHAAHVDQH